MKALSDAASGDLPASCVLETSVIPDKSWRRFLKSLVVGAIAIFDASWEPTRSLRVVVRMKDSGKVVFEDPGYVDDEAFRTKRILDEELERQTLREFAAEWGIAPEAIAQTVEDR